MVGAADGPMFIDRLLFSAADTVLTREIFGNHSVVSHRAFYALSLAALLVFGWGYFRRARLWRMGRPPAVKVNLFGAAKHLLVDVLLQRRVFGRGWASAGHVLLFGGFMGLLLATILLSIEHGLAGLLGRGPDDPVFHKGTYYVVYELLADAFGLALLAGCGIFAMRRWRRDASMNHHWSDWWALGSLAFLGVSGYAVEGLRILYAHSLRPDISFVGAQFAKAFRALGVSDVAAANAHFYLWWVHAFVSLLLIATIPYMRMAHSLTGALRLALAPDRLGVMTKLDAGEIEQSGVIGAGEIRDFSRIQLLELDACMACGRCEAACPAYEAGKPLSPREVVLDLRGHMSERGAANGQHQASRLMHGGVISADTLWSCTACTACVYVCPVGVDPLRMITDMRRYLVAEGQFRGTPAKALQNMGRSGNPWGMPPHDRFEWAAGLGVPTAADTADFDVLYWVGCAAAYDRRVQAIARSVVQLLSAANVRFAVLGPEERCTGESARRMGDEFLFQELASQNIETLARHGVERGKRILLSHCPHCVNSFKQDYPQLGGDYEVHHHTEFLAKLAEEGRLPRPASSTASDGGVTYHDPCYLARVGGVTEPPRELVQLTIQPNGDERLVEMTRNRRNTSCCGAGGGRMWFDDAPADRVGTGRIDEVLATGAMTVAVGCPFCLVMLNDGLAARHAEVEVKDVAELLAESLSRSADAPQELG